MGFLDEFKRLAHPGEDEDEVSMITRLPPATKPLPAMILPHAATAMNAAATGTTTTSPSPMMTAAATRW